MWALAFTLGRVLEQDAFHGAVRRLYQALETEPEPEQLSRMAELLVRLVREPLLRLRHNLPLGPRQVQDHYVAMLAAVTPIMPMFRSVDSIETIIAKLERSIDG